MAIPKSLLEDLLRTVEYDLLRLLAKNYPRMMGVNPPELYIERMATTESVGFVISNLTWEELQPIAHLLQLDTTG